MSLIGLGATIGVNDASGAGSNCIILDVISMTVPDSEINVVESKRLNLTNRLIGKLQSLTDGGTFTFTYEYSEGKKARLDALMGSNQVWNVTMTDAWSRYCPGFLKSNKFDSIKADEIITCTAEVQTNGATTGS